MKSLAFPEMFKGSTTQTLSDKEATLSNLKLLLQSYKESLFGDPYYGTNLQTLIYEQNSVMLIDIIKDEIYTNIIEFMPQLSVPRDKIEIYGDGTSVHVSIIGTNKLNGTTDLYDIRLINSEQST